MFPPEKPQTSENTRPALPAGALNRERTLRPTTGQPLSSAPNPSITAHDVGGRLAVPCPCAGPTGEGQALRLPKLADLRNPQSGSAAPLRGRPPASRPRLAPSSLSAQAGRPSLPACAQEVVREARRSERRSLSAQQAAEPHVIARRIARDLDRLGQALPLRRACQRARLGYKRDAM